MVVIPAANGGIGPGADSVGLKQINTSERGLQWQPSQK